MFVGIIYYEHICNSFGIKEESHNSSDCCCGAKKEKEEKKNEAPVEIIVAETFLVLLRRAAESKLYEKNKGGNVMCQPSLFSWLHAQSLNSY